MKSFQLLIYFFFLSSLIVSSTQKKYKITAKDGKSTEEKCTEEDKDKKKYTYEFIFEADIKDEDGKDYDATTKDCEKIKVNITKDGSGDKGVNFNYTEKEQKECTYDSTEKGYKCTINFNNFVSLNETIFKGNVLTLNGTSDDGNCEIIDQKVTIENANPDGTGEEEKSHCGESTTTIDTKSVSGSCDEENKVNYTIELGQSNVGEEDELKFELPVELEDNGEKKEVKANCTKNKNEKDIKCVIDTKENELHWKDSQIISIKEQEINIKDLPGFKVKVNEGKIKDAGKCGARYTELPFVDNGMEKEECQDGKDYSFRLLKLEKGEFEDDLEFENLVVTNPNTNATCKAAEDTNYLDCTISRTFLKKGEKLEIPKQTLKSKDIITCDDEYCSYKINYPGTSKEIVENCGRDIDSNDYVKSPKKGGLSTGGTVALCCCAGALLLGALAGALFISGKGTPPPYISQPPVPPTAPAAKPPIIPRYQFHDAPLPPRANIAPSKSFFKFRPKPKTIQQSYRIPNYNVPVVNVPQPQLVYEVPNSEPTSVLHGFQPQLMYEIPNYDIPIYQIPQNYEIPIVQPQGSVLVPDPNYQATKTQVTEAPLINDMHKSQFVYM